MCYKCDKGYILNEQDKCDCIKGKFLKYNYQNIDESECEDCKESCESCLDPYSCIACKSL